HMTLAVLCCPQIDYYKHLTLWIRCASHAIAGADACSGWPGESGLVRGAGPGTRPSISQCRTRGMRAGKGCAEGETGLAGTGPAAYATARVRVRGVRERDADRIRKREARHPRGAGSAGPLGETGRRAGRPGPDEGVSY